jgi:hypothetical protein
MISECGVMGIGRGNEVLRENTLQYHFSTINKTLFCRAIAQAVSRLLPTAAARV